MIPGIIYKYITNTQYRFVAVKALKTADAAGTVAANKCALEDDCESQEWSKRLVGLSADGAAVNMAVCSGAAKRLQDEVPHLVAVHCCAYRVELAIKSVSEQFKTLEDTLHSLYLLYH